MTSLRRVAMDESPGCFCLCFLHASPFGRACPDIYRRMEMVGRWAVAVPIFLDLIMITVRLSSSVSLMHKPADKGTITWYVPSCVAARGPRVLPLDVWSFWYLSTYKHELSGIPLLEIYVRTDEGHICTYIQWDTFVLALRATLASAWVFSCM